MLRTFSAQTETSERGFWQVTQRLPICLGRLGGSTKFGLSITKGRLCWQSWSTSDTPINPSHLPCAQQWLECSESDSRV